MLNENNKPSLVGEGFCCNADASILLVSFLVSSTSVTLALAGGARVFVYERSRIANPRHRVCSYMNNLTNCCFGKFSFAILNSSISRQLITSLPPLLLFFLNAICQGSL